MIADGTRLGDGDLRAEVVVVGAGPAGITLALELGRAGVDVLVLESGTLDVDAAVQALGATVGGDPLHVSMDLATHRRVGGASHTWGGRCVPYDPIDLEPRPQVEADWPLPYDELRRFFARACAWTRAGEPVFDAREDPTLAGRELVPGMPDGAIRTTSLERWSLPTNFATEYLDELRASPTVRLLTGLTCTEIVCAPDGGRVECLRLAGLDGARVRARGDRYVLAVGGVESTRLLLHSDAVHPGGIGNHAGHLGRWYQAHVEARVARAHFAAAPIHDHERDADGVYVRRRISFAPALLREHELPNGVFWIVNPELGDAAHGSGILSFVYLMLRSPLGSALVAEGIREAHLQTGARVRLAEHVRNLVRDAPATAAFALRFLYERYLRPGRKVPGFFVRSAAATYPILFHAEHLPHRESRIELTDERDALGVRRVRTTLRFADREIDDVLRAHALLDDALRDAGAGRLEYLGDDPAATVRAGLFGGYHQTGTTRMSADPADGVVDADLAVHGLPDLYVAAGSSLPTSSQANTTFTIVAFALRLADHLLQRRASGRD